MYFVTNLHFLGYVYGDHFEINVLLYNLIKLIINKRLMLHIFICDYDKAAKWNGQHEYEQGWSWL